MVRCKYWAGLGAGLWVAGSVAAGALIPRVSGCSSTLQCILIGAAVVGWCSAIAAYVLATLIRRASAGLRAIEIGSGPDAGPFGRRLVHKVAELQRVTEKQAARQRAAAEALRTPHQRHAVSSAASAAPTVPAEARPRHGPAAVCPWPPPRACGQGGKQIKSGTYTFDNEQMAELNELLRLTADLQPYQDPNRLSDHDLAMRYLIAQKFKCRDADEGMRKAFRERQARGLNPPVLWEKVERLFPDSIAQVSPGAFFGRDKRGYPVYWTRLDPDRADQMLKNYPKDQVVLWACYVAERGRQLCKHLGVDRWTAVTDLTKVSGISVILGPAGRLLREQMKFLSMLYPEMVRYSLLVNSPPSFSRVWMMLKPLLDKRSVDKCHFDPDLTQFIEPDQILSDFGGTADQSMDDVMLLPSLDDPGTFWRKRGFELSEPHPLEDCSSPPSPPRHRLKGMPPSPAGDQGDQGDQGASPLLPVSPLIGLDAKGSPVPGSADPDAGSLPPLSPPRRYSPTQSPDAT